MPKNVSLTVNDRRILVAARNVLSRLGKKVPSELRAVPSLSTTPFTFIPSKGEIERFINSLNTNKQVVVSIAGPARRFTVMTVNGFVAHQRQALKINKARLNKKS